MNISQIQSNKLQSFKSHNDDNLICDNSTFQEIRNKIREHYISWTMPFHSIYEKGIKLTDYQMSLLIYELSRNHNIQRIPNTNIFRGQTLVDKTDTLKKLKKLNIDTVIDLVDYGKSYEDAVRKNGMDYYVYNIYENWWDCMDFDTPKYINKLVDFLLKIQKENIYIGCQHGANDTDIALILNDFFNPNLEGKIQTKIKPTDADFPIRLNTIYDSLRPEHKLMLGWTEGFEKRLLKKLTYL